MMIGLSLKSCSKQFLPTSRRFRRHRAFWLMDLVHRMAFRRPMGEMTTNLWLLVDS